MNKIWNFFKKNKYQNGGRLFFLLLYLFIFLIPSLYTYQIEIPPVAEWRTTSGAASFKRVKRGILLEIDNIPFSCAYETDVNPDCFRSKKIQEGEAIAVEWFYAEVFPFVYEKKVVRVASSEGVIRSEDESRKSLSRAKDRRMPVLIFTFLLFLCGLLTYEWLKKRKENNERE